MQNNTQKQLLCALTALMAGPAGADIFLPYGQDFFTPTDGRNVGGSITLDYSTKYTSRGLAMKNSHTDHVISPEVTGFYRLTEKGVLAMGASYEWLPSKGLRHRRHNTPICDELSLLVQYAHYFNERTVLAGGYQLIHGGLPGHFNPHVRSGHRDFPLFDSTRPEEHSLVVDFHHKFSGRAEGFFWHTRAQYSFRWVTGWWFYNTLGYRHKLTEDCELVATASWTASLDYFDRHHMNTNGTQGWVLGLAMPIHLTRHMQLEPHISCIIAGNGANAAHDRWHGDLYRNGTVVAGAALRWNF